MKLRDLTSLILPRLRAPSTCEACGAEFTCGASLAGCWCTEIKLSEAVRKILRARYRNCLCRACLERFALMHEEDLGRVD
jgi:Cysteine-rich CWC